MDRILTLSPKKAIIIIIITGLIVYSNALFNGFVLDDFPFIVNNLGIHSVSLLNQFGTNVFNTNAYYRPIAALYFAILYSLFGTQAFFYHLTQVLLHILCVVILFRVFLKLFSKYPHHAETHKPDWSTLSRKQKQTLIKQQHSSLNKQLSITDRLPVLVSFFLSLLFLVHPLNVESVAYIGATQSELFFLFGIIALWLSLDKQITTIKLFTISGLLLLSILTKETGLLFLLVVLLIQFLLHRQRFIKFSVFGIVTFCLYCLIRFSFVHDYFTKFTGTVPVPITVAPLSERLINIPQIIFYYLTNVIFPERLVIIQTWLITHITFQTFYLPLLLDTIFLLTICVVGIIIYKRWREYSSLYILFFVWFLLGMLMIIQVFPLDLTVADHWMYFPLIGIIGMIGIIIQIGLNSLIESGTLTKRSANKLGTFILIGIIIIILLSIRTIVRNSNYHDDITLYSHDALIEDNALIEGDLEVDYQKLGNISEATIHAKRSVNLEPTSTALDTLGLLYEKTGNYSAAEDTYYKAIKAADAYNTHYHVRFQNDVYAYINLATILIEDYRFNDAATILTKGIIYYPNSQVLWEELAISESNLHNQRAALVAITRAKSITSDKLTDVLFTSIVNEQTIPVYILSSVLQNQ